MNMIDKQLRRLNNQPNLGRRQRIMKKDIREEKVRMNLIKWSLKNDLNIINADYHKYFKIKFQMNYYESDDFQDSEYRIQDDEDQNEYEVIWQNDMMRYENEEGNIDQVEDENEDVDEEDMNQSEMQKISSTLCMREVESDSSEEEFECDGNLSRTCNSGTLQKSIKKKKSNNQEPKRKIKKWSEEENKRLQELFQIYKGEWEIILKYMEGRTVSQCKQRWQRLCGGQEKKKKWTEEEDQIILSYTKENPKFNSWQQIASRMQGRSGKQIREHYINQLRPGISTKQIWSEVEDKLLLQLYQKYGSKWCQINKHFQGRAEIMLKNRFNKLQKGNSYIDHFLNIDGESEKQQQSHTFSFN
ncbi:unnamed protein product [Paramecium sonneborni]|uniref:Uncharacterized protein n=1 Tax=Paramecium sonneborni TaxID=65129 RepID=A0A8S1RGH2_9CILI|nr:unnamed protein product [Paramecium sonneborni]